MTNITILREWLEKIRYWLIIKLGGVVLPTINIKPEHLIALEPDLQRIMDREFKKMLEEYDEGKFHKVITEDYGKSAKYLLEKDEKRTIRQDN